jgi:hypothetical protein
MIEATTDFTAAFSVDQTPQEVFAAINDVRGWWSGNIEGPTAHVGDEFTYRYKDVHYSKQRITAIVPNEKVVWQVLDSYLSFAADTSEWNGTRRPLQNLDNRQANGSPLHAPGPRSRCRMLRRLLQRVDLLPHR